MTATTPPLARSEHSRRARAGLEIDPPHGHVAVMPLVPLAVIFRDGLRNGLEHYGKLFPVYRLPGALAETDTLRTSAFMAIINAIMGYNCPALCSGTLPAFGKSLLNAIIDLLTACYSYPEVRHGVNAGGALWPTKSFIGAWLQGSK